MGSAFRSPTKPSRTDDPALWHPNSRKRTASAAFPSQEIARKTPRAVWATSPHPQQVDLYDRWTLFIGSARELMLDTVSYLFNPTATRSKPTPSTLTSSSVSSDSSPSSVASTSAAQTSSISSSSRDSPPSSASAVPPQITQSSKPNFLPPSSRIHRSSNSSQQPRVRHIYYQQHKDALKERRKRELYLLERSKGYSSDFSTFKSFLDYKKRVAAADYGPPRLGDSASKTKSIFPAADGYQSERLRLAIDRARDSLAGPGPDKPFIPTLEQLRIADKAKDLLISQRIHRKLPSALPKGAQAEVQAILKNPKFVSKVGREQVSFQDIQRLSPGQWLNDEIINFYGQLIVEWSLSLELQKRSVDTISKDKKGQPLTLRVHYFNTFFWPKLQQGYAKSNLKKWTKKLDIFAKDVVLIPINHSQLHWSAAVINFQKKRIESYDSLDGDNKNKGHLFDLLRSYLRDEHRDKKNRDFDLSGWVNYGSPNTPQQENNYDCGVFTMNFLECVARGSDFHFRQRDMPYLRQKMIFEIGKASLGD